MLRTCVLCCALVGAVGLTIGCNGTKDTTKDTKPTPTANKEESVKSYKTQLGTFDKQVDDLKTKTEKATGEEKTKLEAKLKDATAKRDAAKKKLEELEKAATDKWEAAEKDVKATFDEAAKAVKE
jgi:hypothetical protein